MDFAAVVLAGGAARRLRGAAKPARPVGGTPMLLRVLDAVAAAEPRIVVGRRTGLPPLPAGVLHTVESPPGGGPVAAMAAGLTLLPAKVEFVAVLAADLPFLTAAAVTALLTAVADSAGDTDGNSDSHHDGAVPVDADGRPQWLCGVWRTAALRRRLAELGDPAGAGMRHLVQGLLVAHPPLTGDDPPAWFDCDTETDLDRAEEWADGGASMTGWRRPAPRSAYRSTGSTPRSCSTWPATSRTGWPGRPPR